MKKEIDKILDYLKNSFVKFENMEKQLILTNQQLQAANKQMIINEQKIKESEQKLKIAIAGLNSNVFTQDNDLRFNWVFNPAPGFDPKSLIGKTDADFLPPQEATFISNLKKEVLNSGVAKESEFQLTVNGQTNFFYIRVEPLLDTSGNIIGILGVSRDITDRKLIEVKIKQYQKNLENLVQERTKDLEKTNMQLDTSNERLKMLNKIIRHDISNDFAVIKSAVNLVRKSNNEDMIEEISKRVSKSLKTISEYKKYESFIDSTSGLKVIEVFDILQDVITVYPQIDFNISGKCKVFGDDAIYSVFKNLISNSITHGKSSQIEIKISSANNDCKIIISDNGSGIPEKIREKVFDEGFIHGDNGRTGIGLFIVRETIKRYGGSIIADDNQSNGAVFIIDLKMAIG